jgi:hypothetical protein
MDRRDALKKLGVGGAVAVAAPVLLDSFNVASALSAFPSTSAVNTAAGSGNLSGDKKSLTFNSLSSLFDSAWGFSWADGAPAAPVLVFSPQSGTGSPNTTITTSSNPPGLDKYSFTAVLTVTGAPGSTTYNFEWSGTSLSVN